MSLPEQLYAWRDIEGIPEFYYTDTLDIEVGTPLYNNQGEYTNKDIAYVIDSNTFNIAVTLSVETTTNDATVEFSTGTIDGHDCTVLNGTTVTHTIYKENYRTLQSVPTVITHDQTVIAPDLCLLEGGSVNDSTIDNMGDAGLVTDPTITYIFDAD